MDSGRRNETQSPSNTLLTYTLTADGQGEGERERYAIRGKKTGAMLEAGRRALLRAACVLLMRR